MGLHDLDYARGVAMVLRGESLKAKAYVTHLASLGYLREKMVRRFVKDATPERYRVESGLIHNSSTTSRQCDILVHEATYHAPSYRWEDYVVVRSDLARAVIEVKTDLDKAAFDDLVNVHCANKEVEIKMEYGGEYIPTFGYGLTGVTFNSFINYLVELAQSDPIGAGQHGMSSSLNWPLCIAVNERSYLGLCHLGGNPEHPDCFLALDLSKQTDPEIPDPSGIETGLFLQIYKNSISQRGRDLLKSDVVIPWFNGLPIQDDGKVWITSEGNAHIGPIPTK